MFGTLRTRSGLEFTGYVTWDVDEVYSTDVLDGDAGGQRMQIAFGDIASIERNDRRSSRVTLIDGTTVVLDGTNDVDASISGIDRMKASAEKEPEAREENHRDGEDGRDRTDPGFVITQPVKDAGEHVHALHHASVPSGSPALRRAATQGRII